MSWAGAFHRLRYFCTDAWDEWRHSKAVNLLALGTLAAALFLAGLVMLLIGNVDRRIRQLRDDVRVEVYLRDDHAPDERQALADRLAALEGVAGVEFVDKTEALRRYREWARGMAELIDELGSNPLPASLEVRLAPGGPAEELAATVRREAAASPAVEEVRFGLDWLRRLEEMLSVARAGGSGLALIVLVTVIVVMASVLRLAVLSRREEIDIMCLVGASSAFIRGPFLVAGAVQGVLASALALGLVEGVRRAVLAYSGTGSAVLLDLLAAEALPRELSGVLVLVGIGVSLAGSYFAVRESV
jgi:cell division transport system permease protein